MSSKIKHRNAKKKVPREEATPKVLSYKVIELSNVDEVSLERTLNEWVGQGWTFDGVQFAMRDSSKRPSMGFVFFTKEGPAVVDQPDERAQVAHAKLRRLANIDKPPMRVVSAYERLVELAEDGDDE